MSSGTRSGSRRVVAAVIAAVALLAAGIGVSGSSAVAGTPAAASAQAAPKSATVILKAKDGADNPLDFVVKYVDHYGAKRTLDCYIGIGAGCAVQVGVGMQTIRLTPGAFIYQDEDAAKKVDVDAEADATYTKDVEFPAEFFQTKKQQLEPNTYNDLWIVKGNRVDGDTGLFAQDFDFVEDHADLQWLRDGEKIAGATDDNYVPVGADRGRLLSLRVKVEAEDYETFTSVSKEQVVSKRTSKTNLDFSPHRVKYGNADNVDIRAKVKVSDDSTPKGKMLLRYFVPDIDEPTWRTYDAHHVPKSAVVHFDLKPKLRRSTKWHSTFIPESPNAMAGGHSNDQELKIVR